MLELSALRVLLVDDEAFNRESVRLCLNSRGFKVWEAADERLSRELAAAQTPQTAVINISIPPGPAMGSQFMTLAHSGDQC